VPAEFGRQPRVPRHQTHGPVGERHRTAGLGDAVRRHDGAAPARRAQPRPGQVVDGPDLGTAEHRNATGGTGAEQMREPLRDLFGVDWLERETLRDQQHRPDA
jgi:hypothetical protein